MKKETLTLCLDITKLLGTVFVFFSLFLALSVGKTKELILKSYEGICRKAQNTSGGIWNYEKWEKYLVIHGAAFHFGKWMNPITYLGLCIVMAVVGFVLGIGQSLLLGGAGLILGLVLPGFLVEYMDKKDNENMLTDLNLLYSSLSIQIRAGVYITDALTECYGSVKHIRLKSALLKLSGDIVMKADIYEALGNFQSVFCNKYIDSLCITISQAMESGQAVELLGDIAEQIKDMEILVQNKKKQQLDRSITFYELGIFAAIISFVIFVCVQSMFTADMFIQ